MCLGIFLYFQSLEVKTMHNYAVKLSSIITYKSLLCLSIYSLSSASESVIHFTVASV